MSADEVVMGGRLSIHRSPMVLNVKNFKRKRVAILTCNGLLHSCAAKYMY